MYLTHRSKVRIARRLRTEAERKSGTSLFHSRGWLERRFEIAARVQRREARARYYKELKQGVR